MLAVSGNGLGRDAWRFSPDTITSYLCFLYAGQTLYATDVFATKICVLLFYLRIFPGVIIRSVTVVSILRLRYLVAFGNSSNPTWDSYDTCYCPDAQDISKITKLSRRYTQKPPIQLIYSRAAYKSTKQYSSSR
nr:hypothetical protein FVER53263_20450 [Fusarium verticillioides]